MQVTFIKADFLKLNRNYTDNFFLKKFGKGKKVVTFAIPKRESGTVEVALKIFF
jgi:hypothetical protein